jgi:tRNA modification GTPase
VAFSTDDTIVGIATPDGRGGIGIVRLSGPEARQIAARLAGRARPFEARRATLARVRATGRDEDASAAAPAAGAAAIDRVIVTCFPAPHSYTGEDVAEISAHGSPVVLRTLVRVAIGAGARLAEPGEFTLRAYLNGRIDLVQAEAVADLVDAVTPAQARAALDQLEGTLTAEIARLDARLFDLIARLEASLDFPDEGFHFITRDEASEELGRLAADLDRLIASGRRGRLIREGRTVVIAGLPNAGKSSLFNALVGVERAIVTEVPGTTRDTIAERVDLGGVPVTLVDTAGLRETDDIVEAEGVVRARDAMRAAALTVLVVDGSVAAGEREEALIAGAPAGTLIVLSKGDCGRAFADRGTDEPDGAIHTSVTTGEGLETLRVRIRSALGADEARESPALTNVRHLALVEAAREAVGAAQGALGTGVTEELVLSEIGGARRALEEITGRRAPDDLLRHIFSRFCVGK